MSLPLNWPSALDALANPSPTQETDDPGFELDLVVGRIHDLLRAMEARFGTGLAGPTPTAGTVYGGTGAGTAGYRQVVNADIAPAAAIGLAKIAQAPAFYYRGAGTQAIGNGSFTNVSVPNNVYDNGPHASSGYFQASPASEGFWLFVANVSWQTNGTGARYLEVSAGGTVPSFLTVLINRAVPLAGDLTQQVTVALARVLNGQQILVRCLQTSGGNLDIGTGGNLSAWAGIRVGTA